MRSCAVVLLPMLALVSFDAEAASKVEKDITALQQSWAAARVEGNAAFLESFYAPGFWMIAMDGTVIARDAAIAMASSGEKPESITDEDVKIVVDGLTAIVTGREIHRSASDEYAVRFTNVFVRRQKRWQLLTHHVTRIAEAAAVSGTERSAENRPPD
jgi:ketosteroid isomerase-like protein